MPTPIVWKTTLLLLSGFVRYSSEASDIRPGFVLMTNSTLGQSDHFCAVLLGSFGALQPIDWLPLVNWQNSMPPEPLPTRSPDSLEKAVLLRAKHVTVATRIFHRALFILDSGVPKNLTRLPLSPNKKFVFVKLDPVSFKRLIHLSLNSSAVVTLKEDSSVSLHLIFNPAIIFVHACAITSIILGCGMVLLSWDSLLNQLLSREATLKGSKLCVFVGVGIFVAFCCACLLLYYFLYDVAVYFAIAIYFLLGTLAIAHVSAFWIQQFCADARKTIAINFQIWRWPVHRDLLLVKLCLLPVGLAVMITWVCFRNDSRIGWPLQSVIGIIFVAWILSCNVPCPSLKLITSIFALFVLYDVFFVFITPYFTSHHSRTVEPSSVAAHGSLRPPRSTDLQESYMEAIATGSAGKSGENLPASFRFRVLLPSGVFGCSTHEYGMLLGYGDAVFPGLLSAYLALFDSVWHIRFRRNYLASLFGYLLGTLATHLAMSHMQRGQPALLYLCPSTLLLTVLGCLTFGGTEELSRLWAGRLAPAQNVGVVDYRGDHAESNIPDGSFLNVATSEHSDEMNSQVTLKPVV